MRAPSSGSTRRAGRFDCRDLLAPELTARACVRTFGVSCGWPGNCQGRRVVDLPGMPLRVAELPRILLDGSTSWQAGRGQPRAIRVRVARVGLQALCLQPTFNGGVTPLMRRLRSVALHRSAVRRFGLRHWSLTARFHRRLCSAVAACTSRASRVAQVRSMR